MQGAGSRQNGAEQIKPTRSTRLCQNQYNGRSPSTLFFDTDEQWIAIKEFNVAVKLQPIKHNGFASILSLLRHCRSISKFYYLEVTQGNPYNY